MYLIMRLNKLATAVASLVAAVALSVPVATAQSSTGYLSSNPEVARQLSSAITDAVPNQNSGGSNSAAGTTRKTTSVFGQGNRQYLLQLPSNFNAGATYPVLFAFGGAEHTAERTKNYMRFSETAGNEAIIVYPEGRGAVWEGPSYAQTSRGEDVDFVRSILSDLRSQYNVDNSRIYAAGLSNGGGMALSLACQAPDVFSAVASVAGAYYNPVISGCSAGNVNTLIVHGTSDNHMKYAGGYGTGGAYYSVEDTWRDAADRNGCNLYSVAVSNSGRSDIRSFNGCDRGGKSVLQRVNGAGHTWFTENPNATRTVWNFLRDN